MTARRTIKIILALMVLTGGLLFVQTVFAQDFGVNEVGNIIALPSEDPRVVAARIIRTALGFLGIIALGIVLYGGFVWMTSAGNEEKIATAKKILTNGLIGLVIIIMAFAITQYVINTLLGALSGGPGGGGPTGPPAVGRYSGALGNGIIESHYPPRSGTGIARNTKIIVTFKEPMSLESFIEDYDDQDTPELGDDTVGVALASSLTALPLKSDNIRIYKSAEGETGAGGATNYLEPAEVNVSFTDDQKNFVFDPVDYLGSPSENIWYTVALKPGIKKDDGTDAFAGAFRDGYAWDFETSTIIDTTPPQVESAWPWPDGSTVVRNTLIQINFDEAMDPTTVSGTWPTPFSFIEVKDRAGASIEGKWEISNQYKTVEFTTNDDCGENSCGGRVYCLPPRETIDVLAIAATLGDEPPEARAPSDGVTDAAGNSLNGNKNDRAEGPPADNWGLNFSTNDTIDLIPPRIESIDPSGRASNVLLDAPIEIIFDKIMSMGSFSTDNIILDDDQRDECAVWFSNGGINLTESGAEVRSPSDEPAKTRAKIYHGDFIESVEPPVPPVVCRYDPVVEATSPVTYLPRATHRIRDINQNCFYPPAESSTLGGRSCVGTLPSGACIWGTE